MIVACNKASIVSLLFPRSFEISEKWISSRVNGIIDAYAAAAAAAAAAEDVAEDAVADVALLNPLALLLF